MGNLVSVQVKGNVGTIEDNLNAVEASIREKVAEYSAVVITEDSIADGKKFLADVRKEKKGLDAQRRDIKKKWMAPYEAFETRVKQIIALYDEPEKVINGQLKQYEEMRLEGRRQEIRDTYDFVKGDLGEWLPLERIYNPKWENKTTAERKIREDIELLFDQMKLSISTVRSMESEFEADALKVLKETGSLQEAVSEINNLQKQKERFAEQARREAEEKLRREEEERRKQEEKAEAAGIAEESALEAETLQTPFQMASNEEKVFVPEEQAVRQPYLTKKENPDYSPSFSELAEEFPIMPAQESFMNAPVYEEELTVTVKVTKESFGLLESFLRSMDLKYEVA